MRHWKSLRRLLDHAVMISLPGRCRHCGDKATRIDLCPACYRLLPWNRSACPICAEPVPVGRVPCGRCQSTGSVDLHIRAPLLYAAPADALIKALKFHGDLSAGRLLGQLLARHAQRRLGAVDCIMPVPLHRARLRQRGFNQSTEIARPVSHATGLPLITHALYRRQATQPQTALSLRQRRHNMREAFHATRDVADRRVAVIDDVVTSTETARAAADALRRAGAVHVEIWAVCRTPADGNDRPGTSS